MTYTAATIAAVLTPDAPLVAPQCNIEYLLTDSRRLIYAPSTLFFALEGIAKNGSRFIPQLYNAGVRNFVVAALPEGDFLKANFFIVPDVLAALQQLAVYHRKQFSTPVIGITGSNGKTILKEWLYQLLQQDYVIVRSPKSYNSQIGVPLSIWQMAPHHTLAIIEAGISQRGEMEQLNRIIKPTIGVLTSIGTAHDEGFNSTKEKKSEKTKLFRGAKVVIGEQKYLQDLEAIQPIFSWGTSANCTVQLLHTTIEKKFTTIAIRYEEQEANFIVSFRDEASVQNCITCISVLLYLGYNAAVINQRLQNLHAVDMRLQLLQGINGCTIINDSYSADLSSLNIALQFLAQQHASKKRIVILSDFIQSGKRAEELYQQIAAALEKNSVQQVIAIGENIIRYLPDYLSKNIQQHLYFSTEDFLQHFPADVFKEATVLIKGARQFQFEQIARLLETKVHQTTLQIDLAALAHNLKEYRRILPLGTKIMAMVKAFSYGSGSAEIAGVLQFHGIDYLGVAYADEGIELRKAGIHVPIMVLNVDAASFDALVEYALQPVLYSFSILQQFANYLKSEGITHFPVHIEIESGMNRLGFAASEIEELGRYLIANKVLKIESVFSHLAGSEDEALDDFTNQQAGVFMQASTQLQQSVSYPFLKHIANSAAAIRHPALVLDMVRLGIGLYGIEAAAEKLALQPVASLRSTIAQIKRLKKGESVSYGRKTMVTQDSVIATVRIGYADGYSRRLSNGVGKMWVHGQLAPVTGVVCMDMTMIDVTNIPGVKEGDEVIVFGKELPIQQVAEWVDTIPYEIMTSISQRVKRVWFQE